MTTQQIEMFLSLAEHLNFTKTAKEYFTTQPTDQSAGGGVWLPSVCAQQKGSAADLSGGCYGKKVQGSSGNDPKWDS